MQSATPSPSPLPSFKLNALSLAGLLAVAACGEDPPPASEPDAGSATDAGMDAGHAMDAGAGDPVYLVAQRVRTPDSRSVLLSLLPDLEERDIDNGTAFEVSGFARVTTFGGKVFVFDSESAAITRYGVSAEGDLVEEPPSVSFAGLGITRFLPTFVFASPTRAYYLDAVGAQMVVWDPEEMALVEDFPVPEVEREGFDAGASLVLVGDEIVAPISWTNLLTRRGVATVAALVFSAEDGRLLRVDESDACAFAGGAVDGRDGAYHLVGTSAGGILDLFGEDPLPPPCAVRGQQGTGLDDAPAVDLRVLTGAPFVDAIEGAGPARLVMQVWDADVDPESLTDPFTFGELELWRFAMVDLVAETTEVVATLPLDRR
ncbi:MAG: hypothetical protein AAGH15_00790 [Myxococcota bacterium]